MTFSLASRHNEHVQFSLIALNLISWADPVPSDNDVKAGWTAFAVFLLLLAAVGGLWFSLRKQFRKADAARDAGVLPMEHPVEHAADSEEPR